MMSNLTVNLEHEPNHDIRENCGYWVQPRDKGVRIVKVLSLRDAAAACQDFIRFNELGSGNWSGGNVHEGERLIATISYNGRVWNPDGTEVVI